MSTIGVIGAGRMGNGIAQTAAEAGYRVILSDPSGECAEAGKSAIKANLGRRVAEGRLTQADASSMPDGLYDCSGDKPMPMH